MTDMLNVLVIDDSDDDRDLYRRALNEAFGDRLRLAEASDGKSGLDAIEKAEPHCVLLDYSLPGRNGIEVLKRIRRGHPHLPIILLSGQGNEATAVQSIKEGAQDYFTKAMLTPAGLSRAVLASIKTAALKRRVDEQHVSLEIFTRAIAHDLTEPVRTVCSFARRLSVDEIPTDLRAEYVRHILAVGENMAVLIDTLLSYTQSDRLGEPGLEVLSLDEAVDAANNCMFRGIWLGDIAMVRKALKEGANPSAENVHVGKRALHMAAQTGNTEVIARLLECEQVYVSDADRAGRHAIDLAREYEHTAAETLMVKHVETHPERYGDFLRGGGRL
jgi:CheY-like chemotaxis protein